MATKKAPKAKKPVMANANKKSKPELGKVFIWDTETGDKYERWPVDAREMCARWPDKYVSRDPSAGEDAPDTLAPQPVQQPTAPAQPAQHPAGGPVVPTSAAEAGEAKALELPETPEGAQQG